MDGRRQLRRRHQQGAAGLELCEAASDLRDQVLLDLVAEAALRLGLDDSRSFGARIALVAHGGYGRRQIAPFSDVDLMILRASQAVDLAARLAEQLVRDVFDAGLVLGHSVRTPEEACRMACHDAEICTSLMESRLLAGSVRLFRRFTDRFCKAVRRRHRGLVGAIAQARLEERIRFGETVYLLEPNVKRSRGGLRDLQLLRWIAMARFGTCEPNELGSRGVLAREDRQAVERAAEFLLWLRNEMHFHAGRSSDVLSRSEQVRIAGVLGYKSQSGLLPVEAFMRDYFRHTDRVSHVVARFLERARSAGRLTRMTTLLLSHHVQGGWRVGPNQIMATRRGRRRLGSDLEAVMQLVDLANLYDKPIAPDTWEVVRRAVAGPPAPISAQARRHFLSLLSHPARLGELLRWMHEVHLLERFIPALGHARGLLQFNQYHKYTVDEHCFQAVEEATQLESDPGPLGTVYRGLGRKHVLHLALLIHDLGKGHGEDHSQVGLRIAEEAAQELELEGRDADDLSFLVHKHLLMNHLAFRRDTSDEQLLVRFAVQVGSPELLGMLLVLTAADLAAVGPDAWNGWKAELVIHLYRQTMQRLAGDSPAVDLDQWLEKLRDSVRAKLGTAQHDRWFVGQVQELPTTYLNSTPPAQIAADLRLLHRLGPDDVHVQARYQPETETVLLTVGTRDELTPGIFHKLTGALSAQGLNILSAEINTLAGGLVIDRFRVFDPDYAGPPPPERLERVSRALAASLREPGTQRPPFRRVWRVGAHRQPTAEVAENRVRADNGTSDRYTIFDVFAVDRPGLLYAIARTLFQSGLSVWRAKIGTYLDQVVDVFYVTDEAGHKIEDEARLDAVRQRLLEVIESAERA